MTIEKNLIGTDRISSSPKEQSNKIAALETQVGGGHYKKMAIEPVEYTHKNGLNFCQGNAIKYITRYKDKNGLQDLEKAKHYIDILIGLEYGDTKETECEHDFFRFSDGVIKCLKCNKHNPNSENIKCHRCEHVYSSDLPECPKCVPQISSVKCCKCLVTYEATRSCCPDCGYGRNNENN